MIADLLLENLVAYSLQIGILIGLAAFVPSVLRLRLPGAKLAYWHVLLAVCLLLPLIAPRTQRVIVTTGRAVAGTAPAPAQTPAPLPVAPRALDFSTAEIIVFAAAAGSLLRLAWLGLGLWRLRRYRRRSKPLEPTPSWGVEADLRLSEDVASPVTFGLRRPAVLLPAGFPGFNCRMQDAILAHECLHVRRHDWTFAFVEELIRAVFWFHPAIWWLLGEIQLAREQAVDRAAVEMTKAREEYVDTLLAIAAAGSQLDLAPAPLFLRRRHLRHRVVSVLKESNMSKSRLISALAAGLCMMAAAGWMVTGAFPLAAAPQMTADDPGITVDLAGANLLHRDAVTYPMEARTKGIQGTVVAEVSLDSSGNVNNMRVVSGPDELRRPVLQSLLQWHFARESAGSTRQVSVTFQSPRVTIIAPGGAPGAGQQTPRPAAPRNTAAPQVAPPPPPPPPPPALAGRTLKSVEFAGVSDQMKNELLSRLSVRPGDAFTPETLAEITRAVKEYDEHLRVNVAYVGDKEAQVWIGIQRTQPAIGGVLGGIFSPAPGPTSPPPPPPEPGVNRIDVGGNVQATQLIRPAPQPAYPPLAKKARVSGVVKLKAVIAKDGTMKNLSVMSGHPLLVQATLDAVRQWTYRPTMIDGQPVEVITTIDINFTLPQSESAPNQN